MPIREVQANDRKEFLDIVRGARLANGTVTGVNAGTKTVTDAAAGFVAAEVFAGCFLVDLTIKIAARVEVVNPTTLILDEWPAILATHSYIVVTPPVQPKHMLSIDTREGMPLLYLSQDDGITRESRMVRLLRMWLMSTGVGAAANCSQAFYVPPGVEVVTIELPFTHNANIAVHRYHNDWLSLKSDDAVLAPANTVGWAAWPGGLGGSLALNPVAAGSYSLNHLVDGTGDEMIVFVHPGWYRLVSVAAGADKTFNVCYPIP